MPILFFCDPIKNTQCPKTMCFKNGGPCEATLDRKYALCDESGNPIVDEDFESKWLKENPALKMKKDCMDLTTGR